MFTDTFYELLGAERGFHRMQCPPSTSRGQQHPQKTPRSSQCGEQEYYSSLTHPLDGGSFIYENYRSACVVKLENLVGLLYLYLNCLLLLHQLYESVDFCHCKPCCVFHHTVASLKSSALETSIKIKV